MHLPCSQITGACTPTVYADRGRVLTTTPRPTPGTPAHANNPQKLHKTVTRTAQSQRHAPDPTAHCGASRPGQLVAILCQLQTCSCGSRRALGTLGNHSLDTGHTCMAKTAKTVTAVPTHVDHHPPWLHQIRNPSPSDVTEHTSLHRTSAAVSLRRPRTPPPPPAGPHSEHRHTKPRTRRELPHSAAGLHGRCRIS